MSKVKNIRFNIYRSVLVLDPTYDSKMRKANERLSEIAEVGEGSWSSSQRRSFSLWRGHKQELEQQRLEANKAWKLFDVIMAAINGEIPNLVMNCFGEGIEIDRTTFFNKPESNHLLSFQISRLRANGLPAKKKVGRPRVDIPLEDDEYIGEFTEVVYDRRYDLVIIQSNKYGVGFNTIAKYFNFLRMQYAELHNQMVPKYLIGILEPLVDESLAAKAMQADCYKKIHLRCSDENIDAIIPESCTTLNASSRLIGEKTGIVLDVCLTIRGKDASETLTQRDIQLTGQKYMEFMHDPAVAVSTKRDAQMEVTIFNEQTNVMEAIDLLLPKVNFIVQLVIQDRTPIGSQFLHDLTIESYTKLDGRLFNLLGGVTDG